MKKTDYNLAVYCGARSGNDPLFTERARELGTLCARNNIGVVYGGGRTGLMGTVAGATLDAGGVVYGVVTHKLVGLEGVYPGQTTLDIVDTMHQRKIAMIKTTPVDFLDKLLCVTQISIYLPRMNVSERGYTFENIDTV